MKKIIVVLLAMSSFFSSNAQELAPGVLLSIHTFTPEMKTDDGTIEEFTQMFQRQFAAGYADKLEGMHLYLLEALRGECEDCMAYLVTADSEEVRDRYWNADGTWTTLGEAKRDELFDDMEDFMAKYTWKETYTDWLLK